MFRRLKPIHLYLIFFGFVLLSRIFEEVGIDILYYFFAAVGIWFFMLACLRYFNRSI